MQKDLHHAPAAPQALATVYFGANIPGTSVECDKVTDADFARFLRDSVTPRYSGFTLSTTQGYWKGEAETVRILTVLAEDDNSFRTNIRIIAEHYKSDFGQEGCSVQFHSMRVYPELLAVWACWRVPSRRKGILGLNLATRGKRGNLKPSGVSLHELEPRRKTRVSRIVASRGRRNRNPCRFDSGRTNLRCA